MYLQFKNSTLDKIGSLKAKERKLTHFCYISSSLSTNKPRENDVYDNKLLFHYFPFTDVTVLPKTFFISRNRRGKTVNKCK